LYEIIDRRRKSAPRDTLRVSMKTFAPSARLSPFVRAFMVVEVHHETTRVRLPEPGLVLGVRYRGSASLLTDDAATLLPDVTLTGMARVARRMTTSAGGGVVLALFRPGGAAQFFSEPLDQLFGASVALDELLPRTAVDDLQARVAEGASDRERVAAVERLLVERLIPRPLDPIVAAAVKAIDEARGAVRIGELARVLATSVDPLEKRFRRAVGGSPKQLASLVRIRRAIDAYRPGMRLTQLAADSGYFDQSHFNREFRAVTGQAPGRFFRAGDS
jgi:AraC-like DNA-binding protein